MELQISHELVTALLSLENTIATLPKGVDHSAFYKKQAAETQILDVQTLATSMELTLSADDARDMIDTADQRASQPQIRLLKNCVSVMKYARAVRENTFTTAVLQHENKLLADGFSDFWEEGKVRAPHETPTYVSDGLRNRTTHPTYQLWTDIRQVLSYPNEQINTLLLASITLYHLISSYPFLQFNLQTALLNTYTIIKPSRYWASGTTSIITAAWKVIQKTDFTFDPSPTQFTQFTEKLVKEVSGQIETVHDALMHQASIAPHIRASLNDRQLKILTLFKQHKKLSRKKYAATMNVAIATAFRDLNDLQAKGLIVPVGKGRATSYVLAQLQTPGELPTSESEEPVKKIIDSTGDFEY